MELKLTEQYITTKIIEYLCNEERGNWHREKTKHTKLHEKGVDIKMVGGKRNSEYFFIECKGKSYAKSANSINKEGWLNALGQIITRMNVNRVVNSSNGIPTINRAYKYGLGLYWKSAQVALRRIPRNIAINLNLYIFSCNEEGKIKKFTPKDFGKHHEDNEF